MNTAEKLRFLADRAEDGKEFLIDTHRNNMIYKFMHGRLLFLRSYEKFESSELRVYEILRYNLRLKPQWKFTEDEKVILRNLNSKYQWLVRDNSSQTLYVYENKPEKENDEIWCPRFRVTPLFMFNHLFQSITWEDDEPCEFRRYL